MAVIRPAASCPRTPRSASQRTSTSSTSCSPTRRRPRCALCTGLAKLVVVDIALSRDQDNPQLIFESMNSTGRELSQADLIRNFILMGLEPDLQTALYENYWRPMELDFGQEAYGTQFDSFMRHYLTVKTGDIPNAREVYEAFKDYARTARARGGHRGAGRGYPRLRPLLLRPGAGQRAGHELSPRAFHDLRELKVDVAYPFLLELYHDYAAAAPQRGRLRRSRVGWSRRMCSAAPSAPSRPTR